MAGFSCLLAVWNLCFVLFSLCSLGCPGTSSEGGKTDCLLNLQQPGVCLGFLLHDHFVDTSAHNYTQQLNTFKNTKDSEKGGVYNVPLDYRTDSAHLWEISEPEWTLAGQLDDQPPNK